MNILSLSGIFYITRSEKIHITYKASQQFQLFLMIVKQLLISKYGTSTDQT